MFHLEQQGSKSEFGQLVLMWHNDIISPEDVQKFRNKLHRRKVSDGRILILLHIFTIKASECILSITTVKLIHMLHSVEHNLHC